MLCTMHTTKNNAGGFSLLEIMIALAISVLLLAGVATMFSSTRATYEVNDRLARLQENGRFALDGITREIRASGYIGCNRKAQIHVALTDPTYVTGDFQYALGGYEYKSAATWLPTGASADAPSAANNNDIIVVRSPIVGGVYLHFATPMTLPTDALLVDKIATGPGPFKKDQIMMVGNCEDVSIFQITNYVATTGTIEHGIDPAQKPGNKTDSLGATYADTVPAVRLRSVAFFIRDSATAGKGTSLWRSVDGLPPEEVAEGIERMQILYGVDTIVPLDRSADAYVTADKVTDWDGVTSVSVALLARSIDEYGSETDGKTYTLLDTSFTAPGDRRLRKVFATTVSIRNNAR
jgi:type IV pilus assembly protein PilW